MPIFSLLSPCVLREKESLPNVSFLSKSRPRYVCLPLLHILIFPISLYFLVHPSGKGDRSLLFFFLSFSSLRCFPPICSGRSIWSYWCYLIYCISSVLPPSPTLFSILPRWTKPLIFISSEAFWFRPYQPFADKSFFHILTAGFVCFVSFCTLHSQMATANKPCVLFLFRCSHSYSAQLFGGVLHCREMHTHTHSK